MVIASVNRAFLTQEDIVNFELKRVDVWSLVKIVFFLYAIIGLLLGLFYTLIFTLVGGMAGFLGGEEAFPLMGLFSGFVGFFMSFVLAILYAVFGSIVTAILTGLYNLLAKWMGGVRLSLAEELHRIEPPRGEEPA